MLALAQTGRLGENTALVFLTVNEASVTDGGSAGNAGADFRPGMRAFLEVAEVRQYLAVLS